MKKLIFVSEALWIGGIETALVNLINGLDSREYDITCLILHDYQALADRLPPHCRLLVADRDQQLSFSEPYGFRRLYHLMEEPQTTSRARRAVWKLLQFALRGIEMDRYAAYLRRQLANERFDTCIIYSDRCAELAVKAVNAERFLMYYHHGAMRREFHDEYGYRKSEKIIAVSETLAEQLRAFRPRYAGKIIAINNLVDIEGVREKSLEQAAVKFPKENYNIVSCGRIAREKGLDLAAKACAELMQSGMTDLHWWIVGGGPAESELREQVRQLKIGEHFHFLGMKVNPYPYIRQADLFVQPSRIESFGLTIIEALILGVPVLATMTGGACELAEMGAKVRLCDISSEGIAQVIREHRKPGPENREAEMESMQVLDIWNETRLSALKKLL